MNQAIRISLLLVIFALQACSESSPTATINFANHQTQKLSAVKGQWLVINYWAIWCKPCIEEIPELNALNKHKNIQVLGVNFDQPNRKDNLAAIKQLNIQFPVSETNLQQIFHYQAPKALPTTVIIAPDGAVMHELTGPQTEESLLNIMKLAPSL